MSELRKRKRIERKRGPIQQKILLLLLGSLGLACSGSPRTSWKIVGEMKKEWGAISRQSAERAIQSLYESRLLEACKNPDGTTTLILNEKGKKRALTYKVRYMKVARTGKWNGKLWFVLFDVPEDEREARKA